MKEAAANLYIQTKLLNEAVDDICLGEGVCGNCSGNNCIIGYTNDLLKNARDKNQYYNNEYKDLSKLITKSFDKNKIIDALSLIIADYMKYGMINDEKFVINQTKSYLEQILLGKKLDLMAIYLNILDMLKG